MNKVINRDEHGRFKKITPAIKNIGEAFATGFPFYINLNNKSIPDLFSRSSKFRVLNNRFELPSTLLKVTNAQNYGSGLFYLSTISSNGGVYNFYQYDDFSDFTFLTGKEFLKAKNEFDKLIYYNLENNLGHSVLTGTDHKYFFEDADGACIPATLFLNKINGVQNSGMAVHIKPNYRNCLQEHHNVIVGHMIDVYSFARTTFPEAKPSIKTVVNLPSTIAESFLSKKRDCSNVYGLVPKNNNPNFQCSESHYHFGKDLSESKIPSIVKTLDAVMGVACVSLLANFDDPKRREICLPGDYKIKPSRLEYRALSGAWMCHPMIYYLVSDMLRKTYTLAEKGLSNFWKASEGEVVDTIINTDVVQARKILARNSEVFNKMLISAYPFLRQSPFNKEQTFKSANVLFSIFMNGMETAIANPSDIVANWNLNYNGNVGAYGKMVVTHFEDLKFKRKIA